MSGDTLTALRRGVWGATPGRLFLDDDIDKQKVKEEVIDSAYKKQEEESRIQTKNFLDTQPSLKKTSESTDDISTSSADAQKQKKLLQALHPSDIVCEPLDGNKKLFTEYNMTTLFDQLMNLTRKSHPRFVMTELQKGRNGEGDDLPKDLLLEGERSPERASRKIFFKPVDDMPRIPVGVICKIENGRFGVVGKNVPRNDVNSQYYIKRAIWFVTAVTRPKGQVVTKTVFEIVIDSALGSEDLHYLRLDDPTDWILLNVDLPEERPMIFENTDAHVRYLNEKINQLQEEQLRLKNSIQNRIVELQKELKEKVVDVLGDYHFVGAVGKLADCLIQGFDPVDGKWRDTTYFECLRNVIDKNEFYKKLKSIRDSRAGKGHDRIWVDELEFDEKDKTKFAEEVYKTIAKGFSFEAGVGAGGGGGGGGGSGGGFVPEAESSSSRAYIVS